MDRGVTISFGVGTSTLQGLALLPCRSSPPLPIEWHRLSRGSPRERPEANRSCPWVLVQAARAMLVFLAGTAVTPFVRPTPQQLQFPLFGFRGPYLLDKKQDGFQANPKLLD
ncbi:hypothetical protein NDU88_007239 [Pleurodeles waltl]|uniref:Uncharacterized protein n=1 Tax=Pleurodeles waltl TaxID=8319 RepID=A0AAV7UPB4_PLEWA|nr:hypothetical protein NDU88_007239 [Pleurodeles waltl]